jgi:hypothetical protein
MAAQRLRGRYPRAVSWFTYCSPKSYPKYTQFGELRLFPYRFCGGPDPAGLELAAIAVRLMDTLSEECSQKKSSAKGVVFSFANSSFE